MAKKSLYLFMSSLLGVMLFMILHRILVFIYLYLLAAGYVSTGMNYLEFLAFDYFTLTLVLMLGAWYGIWLGLDWYKKVYEERSHFGFVHHLSGKLFPSHGRTMETKIATVKEKLENDLWELEDLAKASVDLDILPRPVKRRTVRRTAPKKLKSLKE